MKVRTQLEKVFTPIELKIDIENEEELNSLVAIFNSSSNQASGERAFNMIADCYQNKFTAGSVEKLATTLYHKLANLR